MKSLIVFIILIHSLALSNCIPDSLSSESEKIQLEYIFRQSLIELRSANPKIDHILCIKYGIRKASLKADNYYLVRLYDALGNFYMEIGKHDSAQCSYLEALALIDTVNEKRNLARIYNSIGLLESEKGNFPESAIYFYKALDIWKKEKSIKSEIVILANLAGLFLNSGERERVISTAKNAIEKIKKSSLSKKRKDKSLEYFWLHLGITYEELKQFKESFFYYKKIINSPEHFNKNILLKAISGGVKVALILNEENLADQYLKLLSKYEWGADRHDIFVLRGNQLFYSGRYKESIKYYKKAYEITVSLNDFILQAHYLQQLSQAYEKIGDYQAAYHSNRRYHQIQDSLTSVAKEKNLKEIITRYETREKEQLINLLKRQRKNDQKIKFIILTIAILLVFTAAVFYRSYVIKRDSAQMMALHVEEINHKNTELTVKNDELQQFAYSVSHDLKLPVNAIRSYIQLAQRSLQSSRKAAITHLETAQNNSVSLAILLEDLLRYTKVGKKNVETSNLNLNKIVKQARENLKHLIDERKASLCIEQLPTVKGLYSDMLMLFQNLIQNAIKFTPPDRTPEVAILYLDMGDFHLISVQDNGLGIKKEHQHAVFGIFKRVNTEVEGTGIGLALVKKIMDYQGGTVSLESAPGIGSTFHLKFPK